MLTITFWVTGEPEPQETVKVVCEVMLATGMEPPVTLQLESAFPLPMVVVPPVSVRVTVQVCPAGTPLALQVTVVDCPDCTRSGLAEMVGVFELLQVLGAPETTTFGQKPGEAAPVAVTCIP